MKSANSPFKTIEMFRLHEMLEYLKRKPRLSVFVGIVFFCPFEEILRSINTRRTGGTVRARCPLLASILIQDLSIKIQYCIMLVSFLVRGKVPPDDHIRVILLGIYDYVKSYSQNLHHTMSS